MSESNKGGRREGAGRKPKSTGGNRVIITCRVAPETKKLIDLLVVDRQSENGLFATLAELIDKSVLLYAKYTGIIK